MRPRSSGAALAALGWILLLVPAPAAAGVGAVCGNGVLEAGEECDDGNTSDDDACDSSCLLGGLLSCPDTPAASCIEAEKGALKIDERRTGKEKLTLKLLQLSASTAPPDFGDPVSGTTAYFTCVYDPSGTLVGELEVDRAGDPCGDKGTPCWKATKKGPRFQDPLAESDGVRSLVTRAGPEKKGALSLKAANQEKKDQDFLPLGIAAGLVGASEARVQVHTDDAKCFHLDVTEVKHADPDLFQAR